MAHDIAIIGGGLSGLALAAELEAAGADYVLIEARDRLGGRIRTVRVGSAAFDLGPSWFWPGQPRLAALADRFAIPVFEQFATGELSFEDEQGGIQRGVGFSSMEGSLRLTGGMAALIEGLSNSIPSGRIHLDSAVRTISKTGDITLTSGATLAARRIVLAVPPRVAAGIAFDPVLPGPVIRALTAIPTWMGGQAKLVAVYDRPFWRDRGLSGDAMSRRGPSVEIHDASPASGEIGGLFGFLGVQPHIRNGHTEAVKAAAIDQFARLFGDEARRPLRVFLQDWAFEPHTSSALDHTSPDGHPHYGLPHALRDIWDGRLSFCVTETAPEFGGYLEGALVSAEHHASRMMTEVV